MVPANCNQRGVEVSPKKSSTIKSDATQKYVYINAKILRVNGFKNQTHVPFVCTV